MGLSAKSYISLFSLFILTACANNTPSSPSDIAPYVKNSIPANSRVSMVFSIDENLKVKEGVKVNEVPPAK